MAYRSGDLKKAYEQCEKQGIVVGSWGNAHRGYPAWRARHAAHWLRRTFPEILLEI